jgi:tetratricopeptide (TPR) repeat protein
LYPKFKEDGKQLEDAEQIVKFALAGGCTSSEAFIDAAKIVQANAPEFGLSKMIALRSKANENLKEAEKYFKESLKYTEDNIKRGEVYLELADIASKNGERVKARSFAYDALDADPSKKEGYILIGDLYLKSYADCKGGEDVVKDRAVYIAAYDMYKRGGDANRMEVARNQFPSNEDIFNYDYVIGQEVKVNCWIGETVQVQIRD